MSSGEPRIPAYGVGGDYSGARRTRRAFRWCMFACMGFTLALWFFDVQYRYELNEQQYVKSLTHHPSSARAFLRKVVKTEAETLETPNARYVEALAFIEEEDLILPTYERAFELDPDNPFLIINYGCRLYQHGQYEDARERFREARSFPPNNALPYYLQAAAMAAVLEEGDDWSPVFTILAQTNASEAPLIFPEPLWHESLRKSGKWYDDRQREIIDFCCAPLYQLVDQINRAARVAINAGKYHEWEQRLKALEDFGIRLVERSNLEVETASLSRCMAGLNFQMDALTTLRLLQEKRDGGAATEIIERLVRLEQAHSEIGVFQDERQVRQSEHKAILLMPLQLGGTTLAVLLISFVLMFLLVELVHGTRSAWSVSHSLWARVLLFAAPISFWVVLLAATLLMDLPYAALNWFDLLRTLWLIALGVFMLAGLLYPLLSLPRPSRVLKRSDFEGDPIEDAAFVRRFWRVAIVVHWRRYFGILLGGCIMAFCAWVLCSRLVLGVYPYQLALLVNGFEDEVAALVTRIQDGLR